MNKKEIPCIFYIYLHSKIVENLEGEIISIKEVKMYLSEWRLPNKIKPLILKELEILGLIKEVDRRHIKLNKSKFDIEDCNKYYRKLKLF